MCDVQTLFSNYSMDVHYRVCSHTVCGWGGMGAHATLINLYSRSHRPLSVVTASIYAYFTVTPSQGARPNRARPRPLF